MTFEVRDMEAGEADLVIDYFLNATPEFLETLGVDPSRLPRRETWRQAMARDFALPPARRDRFYVAWLDGPEVIGFSSCERIVMGEQAFMHLHVIAPERRNRGAGAACVRLSAELYFARFGLKRLFCEPNALNVAPNRTLQKAGFRYVKTHMTVPGPINFHQPVTRWVLERNA
ncbi:MAG TPA: GNAT family protein [Caulobacteraceae bacterium]|nr:GNAT family protein [Caulobacteraceae bacterium]